MITLQPVEILMIIAGAVFTLFLPGFAWSYVIFNKEDVDIIERIALSFGISIAVVPLVIFLLNKFTGMKITEINSLTTIFAIISLALILLLMKKYIFQRKAQ